MVTQIPDGGVEFTFYRPTATNVAIAGDFNNWQTSFLMTRLPDGRWQSRLKLAPGIYQFRYFADGEWFNDYAAFGLEHGPFGMNSVARVDPPRPEITQPAPAPVTLTTQDSAPTSTFAESTENTFINRAQPRRRVLVGQS
jgi:1,4-alpha-glucan branching enzyme